MMRVMAPRKVFLVGVISLTAGWLVGTSTSSSRQDAPTARERSGPRPLGNTPNVAPFTRQLRERLDAQPVRTPLPGRNPFVFGARQPAAAARNREASAAAPEMPAPAPFPSEPPPPQFRLSGIASSRQDGTTVLTAIVNDNGTLAFVKTGDKLSNGYSVVRVEETGVVIVDSAGITQTLRLP